MKTFYHRTYYNLQPWNIEEIRKSGFKKGDEVWFPHFNNFEVCKGKIKKFDVDIDGDTMVVIEWAVERSRISPEGWSVEGENPKRTVHKWTEKDSYKGYFNMISKDREVALENLKNRIHRKIDGHKSQIEYFRDKLKKLKKLEKENV